MDIGPKKKVLVNSTLPSLNQIYLRFFSKKGFFCVMIFLDYCQILKRLTIEMALSIKWTKQHCVNHCVNGNHSHFSHFQLLNVPK